MATRWWWMEAGLLAERLKGHPPIVGVLRASSRELAVRAAMAAIQSGLSCIELTFTTPEAHRAVQDLRLLCGPEVLIGLGSVTCAEQLHMAQHAEADFLVSPHLDPELLIQAQTLGLEYVPGAFTPSEVVQALKHGAKTIKVFPVSRLGPAYFKDLAGPLPGLSLMATGGISADNLHAYLQAGARMVGVGSIFPTAALENRQWDVIQQKTLEVLHAAQVTA